MSIYLDASVIVALVCNDAHSARAEAIILEGEIIVVSNFATAEVASAINRLVRTREIETGHALQIFQRLDQWSTAEVNMVSVISSDAVTADGLLRRLDLPLRAPNSLHIAVALRLGAPLATFDAQMLACARTLGVPLAED